MAVAFADGTEAEVEESGSVSTCVLFSLRPSLSICLPRPQRNIEANHNSPSPYLSSHRTSSPSPPSLPPAHSAIKNKNTNGKQENTTGRKTQKKKTRRPLRALILAPTRELALQVSAHLNGCLNGVYQSHSNSGEGVGGGVKVEDEDGEGGRS